MNYVFLRFFLNIFFSLKGIYFLHVVFLIFYHNIYEFNFFENHYLE
jgi:hypothetical protein